MQIIGILKTSKLLFLVHLYFPAGCFIVAILVMFGIFSKWVSADTPLFKISTFAWTGTSGNPADGSKASSSAASGPFI